MLRCLKRAKSIALSYWEFVYRAFLRIFSILIVQRRGKQGVVLVAGDVGIRNGPYTFLKVFCTQMISDHQVILSYARNQLHIDLLSLCREKNIPIFVRLFRNDLTDLLYLSILTLFIRPSYLVINAISFGRHLHLLASRVPVIYVSHSIWSQPLSHRQQWTIQEFLRAPHRAVTVSKAAYQATRAQCANIGDQNRISWLHNGVDDLWKDHQRIETATVILTLGTVAWFKNPDLWLKIAQKILGTLGESQKIEFWWGGKGESLDEMRRRAKCDDRIRFLGDYRNTDRLLAEASIYMQLSKFESFGYAICEAMMFGLPCIVTDCGGPTELQVDGQTGFIVKESDPESISRKLSTLISNPSLRERMGKSGRSRYLEKFTATRWKKNWIGLIEKKDQLNAHAQSV
jgi:glycosyltransferase involved in cell wall biosynthesis